LRAEEIGLASISTENGQILLRYPPTPEGESAPRLRDLGPAVRGGKNAYWLTFGRELDWPERLLDMLEQISALQPSMRRV